MATVTIDTLSDGGVEIELTCDDGSTAVYEISAADLANLPALARAMDDETRRL